jgi:hypothetical protein
LFQCFECKATYSGDAHQHVNVQEYCIWCVADEKMKQWIHDFFRARENEE